MTRLSNRQFPMLSMFAEEGPDFYMKIDTAQRFDQRPFRSMLIQKWVVYHAGKGFHITREGRAAYDEFLHTDIARKNPLLPLTAYFDPTVYGLKSGKPRAKVHEMRRRAAAA